MQTDKYQMPCLLILCYVLVIAALVRQEGYLPQTDRASAFMVDRV